MAKVASSVPPGAVTYIASYKEPLDQWDCWKLFVQLWDHTKAQDNELSDLRNTFYPTRQELGFSPYFKAVVFSSCPQYRGFNAWFNLKAFLLSMSVSRRSGTSLYLLSPKENTVILFLRRLPYFQTSQERSEKHCRSTPSVGCDLCCWLFCRVPFCCGIRLSVAQLHTGMRFDLVLVICHFHPYTCMSMICLNSGWCISFSISKIHLRMWKQLGISTSGTKV